MGAEESEKGRLLKEYSKEFEESYFFTGLAPQPGVTAQDQRDNFARVLSKYFDLPKFSTSNWAELFEQLGKRARHKRPGACGDR